MTPDNESQGQYEKSKEARKQMNQYWDAFFRSVKYFIVNTMNLRKGIDRAATIQGVKADVEFKGHAAWILVCSIVIACIGLGENSIPVIVGAMLISPLMGPILGIGLAAGINDFDLLKKSLKNFSIAAGISILISTIYFLLVPVPEITEELFSRRNASTLAVVIAFFGGLAGIIAGSRTFKSNVVPGVAIATALMPPLCTAGFGLATANWDYFLGALYLFLINSVFIAIPTYLYIKYMRFPLVEFVDPLIEKKIRRRILIFIIIIIIPSAIFFVRILNHSIFDRNAKEFVQTLEDELENTKTRVVYSEIVNKGNYKVIKVGLMGGHIGDQQINKWKDQLHRFDIRLCNLEVIQDEDYSEIWHEFKIQTENDNKEFVQNMVQKNEQKISALRDELESIKSDHAVFDLDGIRKEIYVLFPELSEFYFAEKFKVDAQGNMDTIPSFELRWNEKLKANKEERIKAEDWLRSKFEGREVQFIKPEENK